MTPHHAVHVYQVDGRHPSRGHVLLILTDGPADPAAATLAAQHAADAGVLLYTAAVVADTGFSINALLHRARARRHATHAAAITNRVAPTLHAAGAGHFLDAATLKLPVNAQHADHLPTPAVTRLARNLDAAQIITTLPLHEPLNGLTPGTHHDQTRRQLPQTSPATPSE
ncbi:hypothetical protein [Micromonospora endolithica]|uniref:hypothetical protein n=1 Tax=Micromonospora endolithica TaxID=230091 RepID=UPI0011AC9DBC|nr:hypothetical protein [Micromonospora endolithica]TWJ25145.1 hypothetical protein JD76_05308 [Micromonospora endolithica]